jgi:hypothetical protein
VAAKQAAHGPAIEEESPTADAAIAANVQAIVGQLLQNEPPKKLEWHARQLAQGIEGSE